MKISKLLIWICCILLIVAFIYYYSNIFVSGRTLYELGIDNYKKGYQEDVYITEPIERAAFYFEKAIDKGYLEKDVFDRLTRCYAVLEDHVSAERANTKAISQFPKNAEFYYSRADHRKQLKRYRDALEDYTSAIELNPSYEYISDAYFDKGAMEYLLGDTVLANKDRISAIKIKGDPNYFRTYADYCRLWK